MCVRRPPAVCLCSLATCTGSVCSTICVVYLHTFASHYILLDLPYSICFTMSITISYFIQAKYYPFVCYYFCRFATLYVSIFCRLVTLYITVSVVKLLCRLLFPSFSYFVYCYFRRLITLYMHVTISVILLFCLLLFVSFCYLYYSFRLATWFSTCHLQATVKVVQLPCT